MSELEELTPMLEALIFAAGGPVSVAHLRRALPDLSTSDVAGAVKEINQTLEQQGRPYEIVEVAGGYQFRTRPAFADAIRNMRPEKKTRLSRAAMETLAVIAYRQPVTRAEVEDLRCVDCGAVLTTLLERNLVRMVGRRDAPGRPVLYGTSSTFLETFGLRSLRDLPELRQVELPEAQRGTPAEQAAQALAEAGGELDDSDVEAGEEPEDAGVRLELDEDDPEAETHGPDSDPTPRL